MLYLCQKLLHYYYKLLNFTKSYNDHSPNKPFLIFFNRKTKFSNLIIQSHIFYFIEYKNETDDKHKIRL